MSWLGVWKLFSVWGDLGWDSVIYCIVVGGDMNKLYRVSSAFMGPLEYHLSPFLCLERWVFIFLIFAGD